MMVSAFTGARGRYSALGDIERYLKKAPMKDEGVPLIIGSDTELTWAELLAAIDRGGKRVALDISETTLGLEGGVFQAKQGVERPTGEDLIVALTLPEGAKEIGEGTVNNAPFSYFTALETVRGANVEVIGGFAFAVSQTEGNRLTRAVFPKARSAGKAAFYRCIFLEAVELPELTELSTYVFYNCNALRSVSMPKVRDIPAYAFYNCGGLGAVNLPEVRTVGERAFFGTTFQE
jgi:hypothetical protein